VTFVGQGGIMNTEPSAASRIGLRAQNTVPAGSIETSQLGPILPDVHEHWRVSLLSPITPSAVSAIRMVSGVGTHTPKVGLVHTGTPLNEQPICTEAAAAAASGAADAIVVVVEITAA